MAQKIIGRINEQNSLKDLYESGRPEFIVVQGRRRVGKTFLIREYFDGKFAFYHTGLSPVGDEKDGKNSMARQLENFFISLVRYGYVGERPKTWLEAFNSLVNLLVSKDDGSRQVVFLDELPWMDTFKSGFISALESFWNGWGAGKSNLMVIVCGSATSWITDNIINSHGGLFNRTTFEMRVSPFTLKECELFYADRGVVMDRYDQLSAYMVLGGIPYYLSLLQKGMSLAQNIDVLFFSPQAILREEFDRLFTSLFTNADDMKKIVTALFRKKKGLLRSEIAEITKLPYGGGLTMSLKALEASDFIRTYIPFGQSSRHKLYQLTDCYTIFMLSFIVGKKNNASTDFWQSHLHSPELNTWRGLAFERICFMHIPQLKTALGIAGVQTECAAWASKNAEMGAQIDMLIVRGDRIINVCEMKFSSDEYTIDAVYDRQLQRKLSVFAEETKQKMALHLTMITTYGLHMNAYSNKVQSVITMDSLFK